MAEIYSETPELNQLRMPKSKRVITLVQNKQQLQAQAKYSGRNSNELMIL